MASRDCHKFAVLVPPLCCYGQNMVLGTVSHLGLSCGLPESLQGAIIAAVKFPDYARAVRANIIAGGDNASRSFFAGALLAAQVRSPSPRSQFQLLYIL